MSLTRDQLLAPRPLAKEAVEVPEFGGSVFVRVMSGVERDAYEADLMTRKDDRLVNLRARLLVRCVCDESGKLLFKPEDADSLGAQAWPGIDRLAQAAQRINRMTNDSVEDLKGK